MRAAVIDTGCANLPSVEASLVRVGLEPFTVSAPDEFLQAPYAVLPGVGSFGAAARALPAMKLVRAMHTNRADRMDGIFLSCLMIDSF